MLTKVIMKENYSLNNFLQNTDGKLVLNEIKNDNLKA